MRAIKLAVDRDPSPGQFALTGSSNFLTVPTISESLAGRAGFVEVWPFTQARSAASPTGSSIARYRGRQHSALPGYLCWPKWVGTAHEARLAGADVPICRESVVWFGWVSSFGLDHR